MTTFRCHRPYIGGTYQSVVRASFVVLLVIRARMSAVEVSDCISVHLHLLRVKMAVSVYIVVCLIGF